MDGFRDRFGSRYDRNSGRSTTSSSSRSGMDRGDRGSVDRDFDYGNGARNDYQPQDDYGSGSRRSSQSSMGGGGMDGRQLDIIRDYFDEAKDDSKEILHVVGNNSKMLDRSLDILGELKDKADRPGDARAVDFSAPIASFEELSKKNKDEIIGAIAGNADLLNLLKEEIQKNAEAIANVQTADTSEKDTADKEELEKYFADLTDHVHKENVKCYRNVAGALEEQEKKTEEKLGGLGMIKIFSIIQLALIVVNVVLLALYIFRVI